jgi:membrane dipeptidase
VVRYVYGNKIYSKDFTELFEKGGLRGHVDLPRLKQGKAGGTFWSAWVACPKNGSDFSDANYAEGQSTLHLVLIVVIALLISCLLQSLDFIRYNLT